MSDAALTPDDADDVLAHLLQANQDEQEYTDNVRQFARFTHAYLDELQTQGLDAGTSMELTETWLMAMIERHMS